MKKLFLFSFIVLIMVGGCSQSITDKAKCAVTFNKADGCELF